MFGYVRVYKPQLRMCEYDAYKAVYCTLCKRLGRQYGLHARLLLNYDYTFVAMLWLALHKENAGIKRGACVCNPLKKCLFCTCSTDGFDLTCAMTAEMFYYKVTDNIQDSGFFGGILWRAVKLFASPMRRRASKRYPWMEQLMAEYSAAQYEAEHGNDKSIDAAAEPTAKLLSELTQRLSEDATEQRVLKSFGYFFGRWIYLIDAFDDIEKDIKEKSFNPFVLRFQLTPEDVKDGSAKLTEARFFANECLNMTVARTLTAYQLLDLGDYSPILDNIMNLGLGEAQRKALHEKELHEND